jgi:hypothetical protein
MRAADQINIVTARGSCPAANFRRRRCLRNAPSNGNYFCETGPYFSFAYSVFAAMRMGISGSASFHSARKS